MREPHLGAETRRAAVRGFLGLFEPGQIVDLALASAEMGRSGRDE